MDLSPKALRFIIEALDYRIQAYQGQLESNTLDEDMASDIGNDSMYLETLHQELTKALQNSSQPLERSGNSSK
jgi:hypothetical protein